MKKTVKTVSAVIIAALTLAVMPAASSAQDTDNVTDADRVSVIFTHDMH